MDGQMRPAQGLATAKQTAEDAPDGMGGASTDKNEIILAAMRRNMDEGRKWWEHNWECARRDVEFLYGDQWSQAVRDQRGRDSVMLSLNVLPQHVQHIVGAARMSKIGIHVAQVGGAHLAPTNLVGDLDGAPVELAEIVEGLIRQYEVECDAFDAYCHALQHAAESGLGWLRVYTEMDHYDPWTEKIRIEHVLDRWSPMLDHYSNRSNFSDARWGSMSTMISTAGFRAEFPNAQTFPGGEGYANGDPENTNIDKWWGTPEGIRVSEYMWKEPMKRTAVEYRNPENHTRLVLFQDVIEARNMERDLTNAGMEKRREKEVDSYQVKWVQATYWEILKEASTWYGSRIPIVPVFGREVNFQETREFMSLIRNAHDPQRMVNYWFSAMTERVALVPQAPYMVTSEMLGNHKHMWDSNEARRKFYLLYETTQDGQRPTREPPPSVPAAEMTIMQAAHQLVYDAIGTHEPALGKKSNETSGTAINSRQEASDINSYDFIDSWKRGVREVGEILVEVIPETKIEDEMVRILLPDGERGAQVHLNYETEYEEKDEQGNKTGKTVKAMLNNLRMARYQCRVEVGPSFITARREFVSFTERMMQSDPQGFQAIRDLALNALDVPFKAEMMRRLRPLTPYQFLTPEEQAKTPPPEPTPEEQVEIAKAQAMATKAESDVRVAELRVEEMNTRVQEQQVRLEVEQARAANQIGGLAGGDGGNLASQVKKLVAEELAKASPRA